MWCLCPAGLCPSPCLHLSPVSRAPALGRRQLVEFCHSRLFGTRALTHLGLGFCSQRSRPSRWSLQFLTVSIMVRWVL